MVVLLKSLKWERIKGKTYRTKSDSTTKKNNKKENWNTSGAGHPSHTNKDDHTEDVLNTWEIDASQCTKISFSFWLCTVSGSAFLFYWLDCVIVVC